MAAAERGGTGETGSVAPPPQVRLPGACSHDWLFLIYMDISSPELIEPAKAELFELQAARCDFKRVRVVIQTTGLLLRGRNARGTRRYLLEDGRLRDLNDERDPRFGEEKADRWNDSKCGPSGGVKNLPPGAKFDHRVASAQSLKNFIECMIRHHYGEKRRTVLLLWGHGANVGLGLEPVLGTRTHRGRRELSYFAEHFAESASRGYSAPALARLIHEFSPTGPSTNRQLKEFMTTEARAPVVDTTASTVIAEALCAAYEGGSEVPPPLDLVIFDSCFMSSAEVAYQLRHVTRYFIASQGALGFPTLDLTKLLEWLPLTGSAAKNELIRGYGRMIVDQAIELETGAIGLSLFRLQDEDDITREPDHLDCLAEALKRLVRLLRMAAWIPELRRHLREALEATTWVDVRQFIDLSDMAVRLQQNRQLDDPDEGSTQVGAVQKSLVGKGANCPGMDPDQDPDSRADGLCDRLETEGRCKKEAVATLRKMIREAAVDLENAMTDPTVFLAYHQTRRRQVGQEQGASIYLPWFRAEAGTGSNVRVVPEIYARLDLARLTRWADFIFGMSPVEGAMPCDTRELNRLREILCSLGDCRPMGGLGSGSLAGPKTGGGSSTLGRLLDGDD